MESSGIEDKHKKRMRKIDSNIFNWYKQYVEKGKILKVGCGIGFSNKLIGNVNKNITHLDVVKDPHCLVNVKLYDGIRIPFDDNLFDVVICLYTLHHSSNSRKLLKELVRVSKNLVIIYETTFSNIFSKLSLIFFDWRSNSLAKQSSLIQWNEYFRKDELRDILKGGKFLKYRTFKRRGYFKEFLVFKKTRK